MNETSAAVDEPYRLPGAFSQEWLYGHAAAPRSAYPVQVTWRLRGRLDEALLERALARLAIRHEALRTTLVLTSDGVDQLVWPDLRLPLRCIDCAAPRARRRLMRLLLRELQTPFELHGEPLARATSFRLGPCERVLMLVLHHAVADWGSSAVLREELPVLLAEESGGPPAPPAPELQFGDYAAWERTLAATVLQPAWVSALSRTPRPALAGDRPDWTVERGFRGTMTPLQPIAPVLVSRLGALADELRAPLSAALTALAVAALATLRDGVPRVSFMHGNRDRAELRGTVGHLAEPQPLPLALVLADSWNELIVQMRDALLASSERRVPLLALGPLFEGPHAVAREHPFDLLVNYLPRSAASHERQVESSAGPVRMFEFELDRKLLSVVADRGRASFSLLDLMLVADSRGGLRGDVFANERIVGSDLPRRLAAAFGVALRTALAGPGGPVLASKRKSA